MHDITRWLRLAADGCAESRGRVMDVLYDELRDRADALIRRERPGHSFSSRDLLHEAFLRLFHEKKVEWKDRGQFLGFAVRRMRQILVNHGLRRKVKLGYATWLREELDRRGRMAERDGELEDEVGVLDRTLDLLDGRGDRSTRTARILELKYFGGLSHAEVARQLGVSEKTVQRELRAGLALLYRMLTAKRERLDPE